MIERKLQAQLKKHWAPSHFTIIENSITSGMPDVNVIKDGKCVWIELKRYYQPGHLFMRAFQRVWMSRALKNGYDTPILWYPDNGMLTLAWWSDVSKWNHKPKGSGKVKVFIEPNEITRGSFSEIENILF